MPPAPSAQNRSNSMPPSYQKQLWALVDMMVQSKTIIKRKKGELGSQGSFG
jgi:hypothetical protein